MPKYESNIDGGGSTKEMLSQETIHKSSVKCWYIREARRFGVRICSPGVDIPKDVLDDFVVGDTTNRTSLADADEI